MIIFHQNNEGDKKNRNATNDFKKSYFDLMVKLDGICKYINYKG